MGYFIQDDGSYAVYTANGLKEWAETVQSDPALNIILTADIDLTGTEWYEYKTDGEGKLSGNYYWTKQGPITVQGLYPNITVENNGLIWSVEEDQSRIVVNLTGKAHVPFWNIWVTMENKSMSRSFITLMPSFLSAIV